MIIETWRGGKYLATSGVKVNCSKSSQEIELTNAMNVSVSCEGEQKCWFMEASGLKCITK